MRSIGKRWRTRKLFESLGKADENQLECAIRHILHLCQDNNPETEYIILSLPRNDRTERKRILDTMYPVLLNEKTDSLG